MDEAQKDELYSRMPCRAKQLNQLSLLLDPEISNVPALVIHGTEATGKSLAIREILSTLSTPHAIVESRECITGRHLLERTVLAVKAGLAASSIALGSSSNGDDDNSNNRCESLSALNVHLQRLLRNNSNVSRFVLVFDGVDKQREAPATLMPALARLGELVGALTVVLVVTSPRPRYLHAQGVPHVHFAPYERGEAIEVLGLWTPDIYVDDDDDDNNDNNNINGALDPRLVSGTTATLGYDPAARAEDNAWLWQRFCGAVWDSLGKGAASDMLSLRALCERLWPAFVAPIRRGEYGTRDFARLMVRNRALFQSEAGLHEGLLAPTRLQESDFEAWRSTAAASRKPAAPTTGITTGGGGSSSSGAAEAKGAHELPYYSKFLLVAAFLASHNPARTDPVYFMKMHEKKRKKMGGATYRGPGRPPKHRGITRKLLGPQPFTLERWLAVFHAVVPHEVAAGSADLLTQVATLAALRLIVKASLSSNIMDSSAKWRVNVGLEYVQGLAKAVRFELQDYLTE